MESSVILTIFIVIGLGVVFYFILQKQTKGSSGQLSQDIGASLDKIREEMLRMNSEQRTEMQSQLNRVHDQVYKGMNDSQSASRQQFEQTAKIIQDVTHRLTTLDSTNKQVLDFSSQLQNLQDILKNPKQRGILGEYYLETLLKNVLPPGSYAMQHRLGVDEETCKELIPDAVVFVKEKIIPIDSKFSLENYNRIVEEKNEVEKAKLEKVFVNDLKNRIQETSKYIRPAQGTMDFAFMFIPHEAIYYDLIINKIGGMQEEGENLIHRAASKYHVIIVSPTSFLAYLQTVLQALRALRIEETAQDIIKHVSELGKHFNQFADYHDKMGKNLTTVVNQFNFSSNELRKVSKDVIRVTSGAATDIIEIDDVAKPLIES